MRALRLVLAGPARRGGRGRRAARGRRPRRGRPRSRAATRSTPRRRVARRGRRRRGWAGSRRGCSAFATTSPQRRALQLYTLASALPQRLDNALEVQTARAQAQDALATAARDPDPQRAAQARTLLGILTFGDVRVGREPRPGRRRRLRLHRRDPGRSGRRLREVRPRAAAAADRRARHAYRAGPGQRASARPDVTARAAACPGAGTDDVPHAARRSRRARRGASARGRPVRPHPRRRRAPRPRPGGGFGARSASSGPPSRPRGSSCSASPPRSPCWSTGRASGCGRTSRRCSCSTRPARWRRRRPRPRRRGSTVRSPPPPGCARRFRRFRRAWPR